jgi:hypothetical protein
MVVAGVSDALRQVLWEELSTDPDVGQIFHSEQDIVFLNPTETARDTSLRLSLWLYQITENEFVKNQPMVRANGGDQLQHTPLALNLFYLITPFANTGNGDSTSRDEDHMVLGKVMQVFHDNGIILLRDNTNGIAEELRIIFKRMNLEELTRIWEALRESYRLSICYQVQVTHIDSTRVSNRARIVERAAGETSDLSGAAG